MKTPSRVRLSALLLSIAITTGMVDWIALLFAPPVDHPVAIASSTHRGGHS